MNPGGIRGDLTPGANGDVTYGQAFAIQPFSNYLVSMDLKGSDVLALLEQQFADANAGSNSKVLQVSDGFTYTYSASAPAGSKVVAGSVKRTARPSTRPRRTGWSRTTSCPTAATTSRPSPTGRTRSSAASTSTGSRRT
nr:5'-nucleotidase [Angustibacter aerolatus]